jgi:ribosomal protein S27AE
MDENLKQGNKCQRCGEGTMQDSNDIFTLHRAVVNGLGVGSAVNVYTFECDNCHALEFRKAPPHMQPT